MGEDLRTGQAHGSLRERVGKARRWEVHERYEEAANDSYYDESSSRRGEEESDDGSHRDVGCIPEAEGGHDGRSSHRLEGSRRDGKGEGSESGSDRCGESLLGAE